MPQVYLPDHFLKQLKPYAKKFRKLQTDLLSALNSFLPELAQPLGHKIYKLRLKSTDLPRGKSNSFRVIIFLWQDPAVLVPIAFYFKGDTQNLSEKEIEYHLNKVIIEIESKNIINS